MNSFALCSFAVKQLHGIATLNFWKKCYIIIWIYGYFWKKRCGNKAKYQKIQYDRSANQNKVESMSIASLWFKNIWDPLKSMITSETRKPRWVNWSELKYMKSTETYEVGQGLENSLRFTNHSKYLNADKITASHYNIWSLLKYMRPIEIYEPNWNEWERLKHMRTVYISEIRWNVWIMLKYLKPE